MPRDTTQDEKLLQGIRDRYRYLSDCWKDAREERETDMRCVCGDPWDDSDRKARKDAGRPCISHDELNQYLNQWSNNLRQNKRGIKIEPAGDGATDETAALHEDLIRGIEYRSHAQTAYITAGECAAQGSYGFFRIGRRYICDDPEKIKRNPELLHQQEIRIGPILNPDSVLFDWDCKEPDWSDGRDCFVLEPMAKADFEREYPDADVTSFTADDVRIREDWIRDNQVLKAEYWRVETTAVKMEHGGRKRTVLEKRLVQYVTNGKEILEENEQPGTYIPIIPVIGAERYLPEGGTAKRKLFSLVRLARDPQMSYAYLCSLEMEGAGLTPKVPYVGFKGQFESSREVWETLTKIPYAYVEADVLVDGNTGQTLPPPRREAMTFDFAGINASKEAARRAIQAAMGIMPLPVAAQQRNEKSGIALDKIQNQESIGSFHFTDNFDRALQLAGRVIEQWIPPTYVGSQKKPRQVALRSSDDKHRVVTLNDPNQVNPQTQQPEHLQPQVGEHDVTVTTGPSYQSQREAASDFLDILITNLGTLPVPPQQAAKLLALAIQMKQLGPKGDQMAEIISPTDQGGQQQAQQALAQVQQQAQLMQQMQAELQKLQLEKAGRVIDNQFKLQIEQMRAKNDQQLAQMDRDIKVLQALLASKQNISDQEYETFRQFWIENHGAAHEAALEFSQQQHAMQLQKSQQEQAAAQQQAAPQQQAQQQPEPQPTQ